MTIDFSKLTTAQLSGLVTIVNEPLVAEEVDAVKASLKVNSFAAAADAAVGPKDEIAGNIATARKDDHKKKALLYSVAKIIQDKIVEKSGLDAEHTTKLKTILEKFTPTDNTIEASLPLLLKLLIDLESKTNSTEKNKILTTFIEGTKDDIKNSVEAKEVLAKLKSAPAAPAPAPAAATPATATVLKGEAKANEWGNVTIDDKNVAEIKAAHNGADKGKEFTKDGIEFKISDDGKTLNFKVAEAGSKTVQFGNLKADLTIKEGAAIEEGKWGWLTNHWKAWTGGLAAVVGLFISSKNASEDGSSWLGPILTLVAGALGGWYFFGGKKEEAPAATGRATP